MTADQLTSRMHAVLDGAATSGEIRELHALLAGSPEATEEFASWKALFDGLDDVVTAHPPEGLVAAIVAALPGAVSERRTKSANIFAGGDQLPIGPSVFDSGKARTARHPFGFNTISSWLVPASSRESQQMNTQRKVLAGGAAAVVALGLVAVLANYPPKSNDVLGTVVPADRYRAPQSGAEAVRLGDQGAVAGSVAPGYDATGKAAANVEGAQAERLAVMDKASVAEKAGFLERATVAEKASILEKATVAEKASVLEKATVAEKASVLEKASVAERAAVLEHATVAEKAALLDRATVAEKASFLERATVADKANLAEKSTVAERASVAERSAVLEKATVAEKASMLEKATVAEKASVLEKATVAEKASMLEKATVAEKASMLERATVAEKASMLEKASVAEKASIAERINLAEKASFAEKATVAEKATQAEKAEQANSTVRQ